MLIKILIGLISLTIGCISTKLQKSSDPNEDLSTPKILSFVLVSMITYAGISTIHHFVGPSVPVPPSTEALKEIEKALQVEIPDVNASTSTLPSPLPYSGSNTPISPVTSNGSLAQSVLLQEWISNM